MRPGADNLPFAFACGLSLACRLGQLSASIYWSSAKAQSLHLQNHARSQPRGGVCVSETRGMLQMPLGHLGELMARCPQQLIIGLLDGVCNVINRIHIPLISSRTLSATPSASTCSWSLHELLFQCPPWLEKLGTHLRPEEDISGQEDLSWLWDVTSCRRVVVCKVKIFLFLCPIWVSCKLTFCFSLMLCWN